MHLGYVEQQPIPSAREYIPQHADRVYRLTSMGEDADEIAMADEAAFTTDVVNLVFAKHATLKTFIIELAKAPLVLPVFDVSDIEQAASSRSSPHARRPRSTRAVPRRCQSTPC